MEERVKKRSVGIGENEKDGAERMCGSSLFCSVLTLTLSLHECVDASVFV